MANDRRFLDHARLQRSPSLRRTVADGLGVALAAIGLALLSPAAAAAGPLTPLAILLAGLLVLVNALGYAELKAAMGSPGGAYRLVDDGPAGAGPSFLTGWTLALSALGLCALLAHGAARHLGLILVGLGLAAPGPLLAMAIIALVAVDGSLGSWGRWRRLLYLLAAAALAGLALQAAPYPQGEHSVTTGSRAGPALALMLVAFGGLEIIAGHQGNLRRPGANLPRALAIAPAVIAGSGALFAAAVLRVAGPGALAGAPAPLAPLGVRLAGDGGQAAAVTLGFLALLLALRRGMTTLTHHVYAMSQDGFWPSWLREYHPRRGVPVRLALVLGLVGVPVVLVPASVLARLSSLLYLLVLMAVNLTLAWRPRNGGPATFALPFHPWVPALTLGVDALLLPQWGLATMGLAATCLAVGSLLYLAYGRSHHSKAHEWTTVFGPPAEERRPVAFRVLVPVARPDASGPLLELAARLARSEAGEVLALQVVAVPEPVPLAAGAHRAQARRELLDKALQWAGDQGLPIAAMARVARSVAQGILETAADERADLIVLDWRGPVRPRSASLGRILDAILRDAPCDVLVVRSEAAALPRRILVPTAGGPHAQAATRLATALADAADGQVALLHIERGPATSQQMEENRRIVAEALEGLQPERPPEQKVIVAPGVVEGIVREAEEHDLVLLGVSEESLLDRFAFGSVPLQVAARVPATALVQRHRGITGLWTRRFLRSLQNVLPPLDKMETLEVRQELSRAAKPGVNYFVLTVLSSVIAALGLLLDSPAVVIGAMLVAPLMSPILAFSLGLVLGDLRLIRYAVEGIFKGVGLAGLIAAFIGLLSPFDSATGEMLARSQPNLLDMAVALASGMAGAYAIARKDVSAALPGVAIAAALMPPLATVGLALAMGNPRVAGGAGLLFITNIAAIGLAGAVVFLLLGIHPRTWQPESRRWLRQRLAASLILLVAIAVPLGAIMNRALQDSAQELAVREVLLEALASEERNLVDLEIERTAGALRVVATMRLRTPPDQAEVDAVAQILGSRLGRPVRLVVVSLPVLRGGP